jgi:hypothetical protein
MDPDVQIDVCSQTNGLELLEIGSVAGWAWSDPSEGAVAQSGTAPIDESAPECLGDEAVTLTMKGNNWWGSGSGTGNAGAAEGVGFDGWGFWARADGDKSFQVIVHNWQTNNAHAPPDDYDLENDPLAIEIYTDPETKKRVQCAYTWMDSENRDESDNSVRDEGDPGDDLDGDGMPDDVPFEQRCGDYWTAMLTLPGDWQFVKLPFTDVRQSGSGRVWDSLDPGRFGNMEFRYMSTMDSTMYFAWFGFYKEVEGDVAAY